MIRLESNSWPPACISMLNQLSHRGCAIYSWWSFYTRHCQPTRWQNRFMMTPIWKINAWHYATAQLHLSSICSKTTLFFLDNNKRITIILSWFDIVKRLTVKVNLDYFACMRSAPKTLRPTHFDQAVALSFRLSVLVVPRWNMIVRVTETSPEKDIL